MEIAQTYASTVAALGTLSFLMLCQVLVVDVLGIRAGHQPGAQVPVDHDNLLFRASRTVANSNESIAVFILAALFCLLSGASPETTAYATWAYVAARLAFACCYYLNLKLFRSIMFGLSLLSVAALLVIGAMT